MEKIIDIALKHADSAEVTQILLNSNEVAFQNYELTDMNNSVQSGYVLRIIKNGFIGTSYTMNLISCENLVQNAIESLKGKVECEFNFPEKYSPKRVNSFNSIVENFSNSQFVPEFKEVCEYVKSKVDKRGQLNLHSGFGTQKLRLMNSNGLDVHSDSSQRYIYLSVLIPNSYASVSNFAISTGNTIINRDELEDSIKLYNKTFKEVTLKSQKLDVIFSPQSMNTLLWRITTGISAQSVYDNISPIKDKVGDKILSEKFTFGDDSLTDDPNACSFDDEGVEKRKFLFVENGVLKGFYNNLDYASKLRVEPTGHGFRSGFVEAQTGIKLNNKFIEPGDISFTDMIKNTKKGILLLGALGAHSGNIPNGDFSVGLSPGLYIENGEVVGKIKDGMIAGNVYEVMKNIVAVENKSHRSFDGRYPAISIGDVQFSN